MAQDEPLFPIVDARKTLGYQTPAEMFSQSVALTG